MKKIIVYIGILLLFLVSIACNFSINIPHIGDGIIEGSGEIQSEIREVSDFHAIQLDGNYAVIVETGSQEGLRLEAQKEILPNLETRVENGTLVLASKNSVNLRPTEVIRAYVTVKILDEISIRGSGIVDVRSSLHNEDFKISLSGSGNVLIPQLETNHLTVDIPGSGMVEVSGKATRQNVEISGSGGFKGANMSGSSVNVSISGSGSAMVNATDELTANIAGSGLIEYDGSPMINSSITGSGTIRQAR